MFSCPCLLGGFRLGFVLEFQPDLKGKFEAPGQGPVAEIHQADEQADENDVESPADDEVGNF